MRQGFSKSKFRRNLTSLFFTFQLCIIAYALPNSAWAETWVCPRPGQADLYTDREYPGCRPLGEAKTYSPLEISPGAKPQQSAVVPQTRPSAIPPGTFQLQPKKPLPFSEVSIPLPILAAFTSTPAGYITGSWSGMVARLLVGYMADGTGPDILSDSNLSVVTARSFLTAVTAAAKAVGYDPKYLTVRLMVPVPVDGPSAGGIFAVGIASALLGDPIRQDVCMSGTIEPDFEIKPVGRLVDKMNACRDLKKTTMIVPDGLDNSHLNFTGAERSIQVIQVHTLSEAYSAATGQILRQVPTN